MLVKNFFTNAPTDVLERYLKDSQTENAMLMEWVGRNETTIKMIQDILNERAARPHPVPAPQKVDAPIVGPMK